MGRRWGLIVEHANEDELIARVARRFGELIGEGRTPQERLATLMMNAVEMGREQATPRPKGAYVCHTHDYCDANMVMQDAVEEALGPMPQTEGEIEGSAFQKVWNAAWRLARENHFWWPEAAALREDV